jgi:Zn-dependent peptidase ImmA (M78 family)|tara:strand:+ start:2470 stop:2943 length:474 start_codon:yes stop_codon:yes gene_type:complete
MTSIPADYLARFAPFMQAPPIDVAACAEAAGLTIYSLDLPNGVSGMITRADDGVSFECYVDSSEPSVRQRFTAAHELGHFVLHRDMIGDGIQDNYLLRAEGLTNTQEAQANRFAADLLMPRNLISQAIDGGTTSVGALAELFRVSEIAMSIRLGLKT